MSDSQHRSGQFWLDISVAAAAIIISFASLWVALREGQTQERLLSSSVWPYLQFQTGNVTPSGASEIDFSVENAGVGPAKLRWFTLYYKGKAYKNLDSALVACCGAKGPVPWITEGMQDRVLMARETANFIQMPKRASDASVWAKLDHERFKFHARGCYCSVLDECWLLDSRQQDPLSVKDCPPAEKPAYQG